MKEHIIFTTQIRLERSSLEENILGNLIADVYRKSTNADIGMVAPGNLRYIWERGQVTEYEFQNMFPFGGNFGRYNVTGKNLKLIFKTLQEGKSGFYSFSGVNMTILRSNATSARLDTDSVKLFSGEEIIDDKLYSFASNEFMLTGGDDMKNFKVNGIMTINSTEIEMSTPILYGFDSYLRELEVLKEEDAYKYLGRITIKNINSLNILLSK
jgi:2',3'-cyclic-nucleotide 2'-phosphodiesterase (5'-nucleotidase family)